MHIIVIGSGFGGLSAAIRLQAQGHRVTIVEKRDKPGGRAYVYEQDGFTFDAGPTIITAPWLIDELFSLCGKKRADYVKLVPIDPFYNIRFEDGSIFRYNADRESLLRQIHAFNPADVDGYLHYAKEVEKIYEKGFELIDKPFTKFSDMLKVVPDLLRLRAHKSVAAFVNQYIKDQRLQQVFSFHPLLIGGNPFQSSSIYALIHILELRFGIWFAMGGTGALVRALVQLFQDIGGKLILNAEVSEIVINEQTVRAEGVRIKNDEVLPAATVVSNADVAFTYLNLVPARFRRRNTNRKIEGMRYAMSLCYRCISSSCWL